VSYTLSRLSRKKRKKSAPMRRGGVSLGEGPVVEKGPSGKPPSPKKISKKNTLGEGFSKRGGPTFGKIIRTENVQKERDGEKISWRGGKRIRRESPEGEIGLTFSRKPERPFFSEKVVRRIERCTKNGRAMAGI